MNNSKLSLDSFTVEKPSTAPLENREAELIKIIEAIRGINKTQEWSSLKKLLFDGFAESLRSQLLVEARKEQPDTLKLSRLSGELKWAERFSNLDVMEERYMSELLNIRKLLHGTTTQKSSRVE